MASTRCPPVTLAKLVLVKALGMNAELFVTAEARYVPLRTWYWSTACRRPGFEAKPAPALLLSRVAKAAFDGASNVMFERLESDSVMPGKVPNKDANWDVWLLPVKVAARPLLWAYAADSNAATEKSLQCIFSFN